MAILAVTCMGTPAQDVAGSIAGHVTDSSGAVISGVEIVATHIETGSTRRAATGSGGDYAFPNLTVGTYDLAATHAGFKKSVRTGVVLHVSEHLGVDLALEVGELAQEISVEAGVEQVRTESGEQGGVITGEQVRELQLNGRSFMTLLELLPGVSSNMSDRADPNTNPDVSINGARSSASNFNIDGGSNVDVIVGSSALNTFTSVETIAEFNVLTSTFSAEYGRGGFSQINVVTRGGTRKFHGSLFEFFRNDALDARDYFSHQVLPLKLNDFGYTVGGPLTIGGYNRSRNKTFFFVAQEFNRLSTRGAAVNTTVPAEAERRGDFRGLGPGRDGAFGTADDPVIDPTTNAGFPGGIIPANRINPNSAQLAALYPLPNFAGPGVLNYTSAAAANQPFREDMARIDHHFTPNVKIYGRYTQDNALIDNPYGGSGYASVTTRFPGIARTNSDRPGKNLVINATQILRSTWINQFSFSYSRRYFDMHPVAREARRDVVGLSIPEIFPENEFNVLPVVNLTNYASISVPRRGHKELYTIEFADNVSHTFARHVLKTGASYYRGANREQQFSPNVAGTLNFDTAITKNPVAALLLGLPSTYTESEKTVFSDIRFATLEAYLQDDFKLTPRLTLNFGLRVTNFFNPYDLDNVLTNFLPWRYDIRKAPSMNPANGQLVPGTGDPLNGITIAGKDSPYGRRVTNNNNHLLGPRFGFAWSPLASRRFAVRGGYGIYYTRALLGTFENNAFDNPPFTRSVTIQRPTLADPGGGLLAPATAPVNLTALGLPLLAPTMQQWSFGVESQVVRNTVLGINYVASRGTHFQRPVNWNNPAPGAAAAQRVNVNFVRPYFGYGNITVRETSGASNYNSLQASLNRRLSGKFSLGVAYTWAKSIDNGWSERGAGDIPPNTDYIRAERGPSDFDRRHIFTSNFNWYVPRLARGALANPPLRAALDGWQISGIARMWTGFPLDVVLSQDVAGIGGVQNQRPNIIGDTSGPRTVEEWFNRSAFGRPANGTFGNMGRNSLRGPGVNKWDLSAFKNFQIREGMKVQFRSEFFNAFNHPSFTGIGRTLNTNATGVNPNTGNFAVVTDTRDARVIQFGLKLNF